MSTASPANPAAASRPFAAGPSSTSASSTSASSDTPAPSITGAWSWDVPARAAAGEWVFLVSLYATAAYAGVLLALAEGAALPAALTPAVAVAAALLVEKLRVFRLSVMWANALGLVAAAAAVSELLLGEIEARLLFGAHLLVYLSWIVLFQQKDPRVFWATLTLALLQAAVASVLASDGGFGLALSLFLPTAVWTLMVHQLVRPRLTGGPPPGTHAPGTHAPGTHAPGHAPPGRTPRVDADGLRVSEVEPAAAPPERSWRPLAGTAAAFTAAAAVAGVCVFLLMPRVWTSRRPPIDPGDGSPALRSFTGFNDEVRLGALGEILESSEPAFTVALHDHVGGERRDVEGYARHLGMSEPRFRGRVLDQYRDGRWTATDRVPQQIRAVPDRAGGGHPPLVVQSVRLRPVGGDVLFSLAEAVALRLNGSNQLASRRVADGLLMRPEEWPADRDVGYEVLSAVTPRAGDSRRGAFAAAARTYRDLPRLPALRRVAAEVAGDARDPAEVVRRLGAFLNDPDEFRYTLNQTVVDPALDPIEDFLLNKKAGHCEYFASALALMLRARGIPSRLVTGFKGGKLNPLTDRFEVQQRHAHAWVEAFLADDPTAFAADPAAFAADPAGGRPGGIRTRGGFRPHAAPPPAGAWVTFDPTPAAARTASVADQGPRFTLFNDLRTWANNFWSENVVQMNLDRQRAVLFDPLRRSFEHWKSLARERGVAGVLGEAGSLALDPRRWVSLEGGFATFVLLWLAAGVWWAVRRFRPGGSRGGGRRTPRTVVPFYERFRRLAADRGLTRAAGETDREFAEQVRATLAPSLPPDLADAPARLADEFYRVRFGEAALDGPRAARWTALLDRLEAALADAAAPPDTAVRAAAPTGAVR